MATAAAADLSGFTLVPTERLRALEALEAEQPILLEKLNKYTRKDRLEALRMRDKEDPKSKYERNAEWKKNHREEYNAKRREQYRQKKEAELAAKMAGAAGGAGSPGSGGAAADPDV